MITCDFCGYKFNESECISGCNGCPLHKTCSKTKCPNCGYEILKEPKIIKYIKRKWGKK